MTDKARRAIVAGAALLAAALAAVALALAGIAWYWAALVIGAVVPLAGKAAKWRVALAITGVAALCAAGSGWWYSHHVWRLPRKPDGPFLLKGCSCPSPRGPIELLLTINKAAPAGEARRYDADWALGVSGHTNGLWHSAEQTAPPKSLTPGKARATIAMACTDSGVLLASGDRATLWDFGGKALASTKLPAPIASERSLFADEGVCHMAPAEGGAITLRGEGRSMRIVPTGMVLYVE